MTPPAKKALPRLSDLGKNTDDNQDGTVKPTDTELKERQEEKHGKDQDTNTDNDNQDNPDFVEKSNEDTTDMDTTKPGSEIVETEKGVDNQVEFAPSDGSGNVNGVTFNGAHNVINKTPAGLAAETPEETARRYGITDEVPEDVHNNPNVVATNDNRNFQIPSGTHVHPDVAKDNYNRIVGGRTENGEVTVNHIQHVYATEAPVDDKGIKNEQPEDLA